MAYATDRQLAARFGVHRATIWRWEAGNAEGFPKSVQLSPGCRRWCLADVEAWEKSRAAA
ncbi:AlpA family phage regulatory protein [Gemmobacter fulvus]|uniref:AlpA family phage regulatory protein n=1 Tax=Gemmobacter fulvus TaxID=2840474 RepID=A0A975P4J6_9RHOB|nr:AlpA family phage regulatory protein [Gemmobacter fulvus]QWK89237.1 AlpA family phage regulatory protein [Gemmobacter fulvus]